MLQNIWLTYLNELKTCKWGGSLWSFMVARSALPASGSGIFASSAFCQKRVFVVMAIYPLGPYSSSVLKFTFQLITFCMTITISSTPNQSES